MKIRRRGHIGTLLKMVREYVINKNGELQSAYKVTIELNHETHDKVKLYSVYNHEIIIL